MKPLFIIALLIVTTFGFSQNQNEVSQNQNLSMQLRANKEMVLGTPTLGVSMHIVNPSLARDGSVYLFDRWDNDIIIVTDQGDKMTLDNINLNVDRNTFESKFGGDSIFSFNFNNIDRFIINNRAYKNYFWKDDNRVYEVLAETKDFSILKGFNVTLVEGSVNPMMNRSRDKFIMRETYYIKRQNSIKPFALRKGIILKLFAEDKANKKAIKDFVEKNNLSFKSEADIDDIINFAIKK